MPKLPQKFHRPTLAMLPRVIDQLSFVYINMARIERDDNGVHAIFRTEERGVERVYLPTASIAAILLGSGTSVTQPAAAQILRDGGIISLSGEAGALHHGAIAHNTLTTRWLHRQARLWADDGLREETARRLYHLRFDDNSLTEGKSIEQLRGMEGHRVKRAYQTMSKQYRIPFRRAYNPDDFDESDPVNQALTTANHLLYGTVHSVIVALGCSPALGFIHTGAQFSFVYDLADLYKLETSVPAAFASAKSEDAPVATRRALRKNFRLFRLTRRVVADLQHVLDPDHQPARDLTETEDDGIVHLWSPDHGPIPAGTNYAELAEAG